jgi:hypothetical protein
VRLTQRESLPARRSAQEAQLEDRVCLRGSHSCSGYLQTSHGVTLLRKKRSVVMGGDRCHASMRNRSTHQVHLHAAR